MTEVKTMQEAVAEAKKKPVISQEKTLFDEFFMAAITGILSSNGQKNVAQRAFEIASDAMDERKRYFSK